jgi:hypothetical protein
MKNQAGGAQISITCVLRSVGWLKPSRKRLDDYPETLSQFKVTLQNRGMNSCCLTERFFEGHDFITWLV